MANLRTITNFKSALRGGGARPNLFEVDITGWPGGENMGDFGQMMLRKSFNSFAKQLLCLLQTLLQLKFLLGEEL